MYKLFDARSEASYAELQASLQPEAQPSAVIPFLQAHLGENVRHILLEEPYVDKDYRSTYYSFYSKKNLHYAPYCSRIHFFSDGVSLDSGYKIQSTDDQGLQAKYLGFVTVRPTGLNTIGRSAVSPRAIKSFSGHVMVARHKVHLLGHRLTVEAFPWMQQPSDIAVCAHIACWSILRFYSERFSNHRDFLLYDITRMASPIDPGGGLPSRGLFVSQASRILSQGEVFPDTYGLNGHDLGVVKDHESFLRTLFAYVESGFPIFASISNKHALAIIGHGDINQATLASSSPVAIGDYKKKVRFGFNGVSTLVVADDSEFPYHQMQMTGPGYSASQIKTFIVPLPDKIYFHADAVEEYTFGLFDYDRFGLDLNQIEQPVIRYFLTTSSSLQQWYLEHEVEYDSTLIKLLLDFALPRFVWVVEVGCLTDWGNGECNARLVLDATASQHELQPFILLHTAKKAVVYNRPSGNGRTINASLNCAKASFLRFVRNLAPH